MARGCLVWIALILWPIACVGGFESRDGGADADTTSDASKDAEQDSDIDEGAVDGGDLDSDGIDADMADADTEDGDIDLDMTRDGEPDGELDAEVDVDPDEPPCVHPLSGDTLASYSFEGDTNDDTGAHHGVMYDLGGCVSFIDGPARCGGAIFFSGDCPDTWVEVEHSPEWDDVMSIDFWLWQNPAELSGILSRDALGALHPGHITVAIASTGHLFVRVQRSGTISTMVCSDEPMPDSTWFHVGINLGAPGVELWVGGVQQAGTGSIRIGRTDIPCEGAVGGPYGIDGNENPWVIGGMTWDSEEGSSNPVKGLADTTAIDQLRFSSSRQDFSIFP